VASKGTEGGSIDDGSKRIANHKTGCWPEFTKRGEKRTRSKGVCNFEEREGGKNQGQSSLESQHKYNRQPASRGGRIRKHSGTGEQITRRPREERSFDFSAPARGFTKEARKKKGPGEGDWAGYS